MQQARPNNISTRIARDFPASFTPDRNFRTAGQILGSSCSGATPIDSPIGPVPCDLPVTGERQLERDLAPQRLPVDGPRRPSLPPGQGPPLRVFQPDHHRQGGLRHARGLSRPSPAVAHEQPAAQHELDEDPLLERGERDAVLVGAALRRAGEPHADIPGITVTGIQGYQVGWGPNIFVQNSFMWSDVVTWTRGAHSMKFGAGYTREHADNDSARAITRPTFSFDSVFDFAADAPTSREPDRHRPAHRRQPPTRSSGSTAPSRSPPSSRTSGRCSRNITLSAGLRYEAFMNITDASDDTVTNIEFPVETGNLQSDLASARMVQRQ